MKEEFDALFAEHQKLLGELQAMRAVKPAPVQGWKLVPVEPTEDMWKAVNKLDDEMAAGSYDGKGCSIEQAWDCLLAAAPQPAQRTDDTKRLDALAENSWDLRCFDMPTGADDADIGWRVIEHHMAQPHERTVTEVFRDDPRQAIDEAIEAASNTKEQPTS